MKSKLTLRRYGLWAVLRWIGGRRRRLFAGNYSRCQRWKSTFANAQERRNGIAPFLFVRATKPYRISLVAVPA